MSPRRRKPAPEKEAVDAEVVDPADEEPAGPDADELSEDDVPADLPVVGVEPEGAPEVAEEKGLARWDPLQLYINEIRKIPLLSREEEHQLAAEFVKTQSCSSSKTCDIRRACGSRISAGFFTRPSFTISNTQG